MQSNASETAADRAPPHISEVGAAMGEEMLGGEPTAKAEHMIVEMMGHARYGARVEQTSFLGVPMLRCHVLHDPPFEQLVSPAAIFRLTRCSEAQARAACVG